MTTVISLMVLLILLVTTLIKTMIKMIQMEIGEEKNDSIIEHYDYNYNHSVQ